MADVTFRIFPAGHFGVLRGALEKAVEALPKVERTSAIKACLADKILTLAATGETDSINLAQIALEKVRESCGECRGCEGLAAIRPHQLGSFQRHLSSQSGHGARKWN
jgi:hypothetical protein